MAYNKNKATRELTDEEMALPGSKVTNKELEAWLDKPDTGHGSKAEVVRIRLKKNLQSGKLT